MMCKKTPTFPSGKNLLIMLKGPWIKMTFQIKKGKELLKEMLKKDDDDIFVKLD